MTSFLCNFMRSNRGENKVLANIPHVKIFVQEMFNHENKVLWISLAKTRHVLTGQIPPATTTPGSRTTIVWSIIPIQVPVKGNGPVKNFVMCKLWPWPWQYDPESSSWYDCLIYYQDPTWQWGVMAKHGFWFICAQWPWPWETCPWVKVMTHPWVMDNSCVKYYPDPTSEEGVLARIHWPGYWVIVHCDLDIRDMTFIQGHDTLLGHGQ